MTPGLIQGRPQPLEESDPAPGVVVIRNDAEAIQVASELASQLRPGASERDRDRRLPAAEMDLLSASGLLGVTVPKAHGGAAVSTETLTRVFTLLSAADAAIGQLPQNHFLFVEAIKEDGSPEQKRFFFREILAGKRFGNAQAERGSGSALNLRTRLTAAPGGGYRLNGAKYYCTGAILAHWIPVSAIDDEGRSVLAYVPRTAAGVEVRADWSAMGQRTTYSGTSVFTDVAVPEDWVIPHWRLFERDNLFHPLGALLHAAIDVGIAQNALEDGLELVRARGRPRLGAAVATAGEDPHVLAAFGRLAARVHAAEQLLLWAARGIDDAGPAPEAARVADAAVRVAEAKAFAEDVALEAATDIFAQIGSSAADEALNLDRHWRNARTHTIHDANAWRYHVAGDYHLNGVPPGKPLRRLAES
jgi:SfnB family sulfur acquisition oxidoreductase